VTAEYNYASGDADPVDGIRGTFDQLYPTAHDKYGLADQVDGGTSTRSRRLRRHPDQGTPTRVNYHSYWLAENGTRSTRRAAPAGAVSPGPSRRVGQRSTCSLAPLFPRALPRVRASLRGAFLKQATPASPTAALRDVTYVFLAEKEMR
jgi:hypothetical protein